MLDNPKFQCENYTNALGRIEKLVDSQSFSQIGAYIASDNVVAGFASIDTRPCYIYSQYGPVTLNHASKIARIYKMAIAMGAPVISILDSEGIHIESGLDVLAAYGEIFATMSEASGVIPQFSLIYGKCMGANAVISGLSDFSFGLKDSKLFIQSPNTAEDIKSVGVDEFMSSSYHFKESGQLHFLFDNSEDLNVGFREFFSFMPSNNLEEAPVLVGNDVPSDEIPISANMSAAQIVGAICDNGEFVEISASYGAEVAAFFTRFDGYTALCAVNNGDISKASIAKLVKLIAFCDAFNIPIVTLANAKAFKTDVEQQKNAISDIASLSYVFTNSTVPKINIVTGDAIGLAGLVFNSKFIGADVVYAWPEANLSLFSSQAKKVLNAPDIGTEQALLKGYVDEVIEPSLTRKYVIRAIDNLSTKRISRHPKKHGSFCF